MAGLLHKKKTPAVDLLCKLEEPDGTYTTIAEFRQLMHLVEKKQFIRSMTFSRKFPLTFDCFHRKI